MNQKIPIKLRFGRPMESQDGKDIEEIIDDAYKNIAPAVNRKPDIVIETSAPTSADNSNQIGTFWLNTTVPNLYILTALDKTVSPATATWTTVV